MEWNVSPMSHDARALFSPGHAPVAGKVIPMKGFCVEFAGWPTWEPAQNVSLGDERFLSPPSVSRFGEVVFEFKVGPNANQKNSFPVLRDAEIAGI